MKHLKLIHTITGLLALLFLIPEGTIVKLVNGTSREISTILPLLLSAALINLSLASYLTVYRCSKRFVQGLGSLAIMAATVVAIVSLFEQKIPYDEVMLTLTTKGLLIAGVLLHLAINLKTSVTHARHDATPRALPEEGRETGSVKWFNVSKGFGFITRDRGGDVFVHYRAIRGDGHKTLSESQRVEFYVVDKEKGSQAEDVVILSNGY